MLRCFILILTTKLALSRIVAEDDALLQHARHHGDISASQKSGDVQLEAEAKAEAEAQMIKIPVQAEEKTGLFIDDAVLDTKIKAAVEAYMSNKSNQCCSEPPGKGNGGEPFGVPKGKIDVAWMPCAQGRFETADSYAIEDWNKGCCLKDLKDVPLRYQRTVRSDLVAVKEKRCYGWFYSQPAGFDRDLATGDLIWVPTHLGEQIVRMHHEKDGKNTLSLTTFNAAGSGYRHRMNGFNVNQFNGDYIVTFGSGPAFLPDEVLADVTERNAALPTDSFWKYEDTSKYVYGSYVMRMDLQGKWHLMFGMPTNSFRVPEDGCLTDCKDARFKKIYENFDHSAWIDPTSHEVMLPFGESVIHPVQTTCPVTGDWFTHGDGNVIWHYKQTTKKAKIILGKLGQEEVNLPNKCISGVGGPAMDAVPWKNGKIHHMTVHPVTGDLYFSCYYAQHAGIFFIDGNGILQEMQHVFNPDYRVYAGFHFHRGANQWIIKTSKTKNPYSGIFVWQNGTEIAGGKSTGGEKRGGFHYRDSVDDGPWDAQSSLITYVGYWGQTWVLDDVNNQIFWAEDINGYTLMVLSF